jgi:hypothetical protein
MRKQPIVAGYRVVFALLGIVAMTTQLVQVWDRPNNPANFFSFFTIESNILAVAVLLYGVARPAMVGRSPTLDLVRGAAVLYMTVTFVVYGVLLAGYQEELQTTIPWVDTVVHRVLPIVMLLDWIIDPPDNALTWKRAIPFWLVPPAAYLTYSLIRGPIVDWYPYPFLNPDEVGGYAGVATYAVGIAALAALGTWVIVWIGRRVRIAIAPEPVPATVDSRRRSRLPSRQRVRPVQ